LAAGANRLRRLLQTNRADLFMYIANATALGGDYGNLLAPEQSVLIPGTGHFSEQWAIQAEATGRRVIRTPYREGYLIDPNDGEQPRARSATSPFSPCTPTPRAALPATSKRCARRSARPATRRCS
jgi:hypothetical protein